MEQVGRTSLSVLVIAKHEPTIDWTQFSLQEQNYKLAGQVDSVDQALQKLAQAQVDIILADSSGDGVLEIGWIQRLVVQIPGLLILVSATNSEMDFVREAMLVGAKGFLLKPYDLAELSRSIEQVYQLWLQHHELMAQARDEAQAPPVAAQKSKAHSIAVFSPKGGTGVTTLAVNLAVALKQQTKSPVLLVDADLNTADIDIFLSVFNNHSILDLIDLKQEIDQELLKSVATEHPTGITVLRGESRLQFLESPINPGQMNDLVKNLIAIWEGYIVFNTNNGLDRWTLEVLDLVDTVLTVTTPQLPALRVMRNFLELAEAADDESDKWQVVMMSYQGKKTLKIADVETSIHYPIKATIAEDVALVSTSVNRGTPLITAYRKSSVTKDIAALAEQLAAANPNSSPPHMANGKQSGLDQEKADQVARSGKGFSLWNSLSNAVRPPMRSGG